MNSLSAARVTTVASPGLSSALVKISLIADSDSAENAARTTAGEEPERSW
jgi:hypothetical protein